MLDATALEVTETTNWQSAQSRRRRLERSRGVGGGFQFWPDDGFMGTADGGTEIDRGGGLSRNPAVQTGICRWLGLATQTQRAGVSRRAGEREWVSGKDVSHSLSTDGDRHRRGGTGVVVWTVCGTSRQCSAETSDGIGRRVEAGGCPPRAGVEPSNKKKERPCIGPNIRTGRAAR